MDYNTVLEKLAGLGSFTEKHDLAHTGQLLAQMGSPEKGRHVIHVAGTNGKGSVCAMLSSVLREAGLSVGLFTSPHLVDLTERVRINEKDVTPEAFAGAFAFVEDVIEASGLSHPTYFETCFLTAMECFRRADVAFVILETGMGGRLDATNVIKGPALTILTSISFDHQEFLGDTLAAIAGEKAGILKEGVPVVYERSTPESDAVIRETAVKKRCDAYDVAVGDHAFVRRRDGQITFSTNVFDGKSREIRLPTLALYQIRNAAIVLKALAVLNNRGILDPPVSFAKVQAGILKMRWSGRMQWVGPEIVLDGAHNIAGAQSLIESLAALPARPKHLLFAVSRTKDRKGMIEVLCRTSWESITLTQMQETLSGDPVVLQKLFREHTTASVEAFQEAPDAYRFARERKRDGELLVIAGSLYFIGELKKNLGGELC